MSKAKQQVLLVVLDGWGHRDDTKDNAIAQAHTPFIDHLMETYPHALLAASGAAVGLPDGQSGNSEVGHITIGTGQIVYTDLMRINKAFADGSIRMNPVLCELIAHIKANDSTLHLLGLLSPGGVHSHQEHLHGIIRLAKSQGITKIAIHAFTDGRDTPPQSAGDYLKDLEAVLAEEGVGRIATAMGRFYAMDRDQNWDRVLRAEDALFHGHGATHARIQASQVIAKLHAEGMLDEHLEPVVFLDDGDKAFTINKNDGMLFFNFRPDRARMLARRIAERAEKEHYYFATLTDYDERVPAHVVFPRQAVDTSIAKAVSEAGLTQAHIAETEKYAHATYFLNGGKEVRYPNEEDVLIASRKDVQTHDLAPEMRAKEVTDAAITSIRRGTDFIFINYANADMVAHTANKEATLCAVETIDEQLKRLAEAAERNEAVIFITADHGNAELNIDPQTHAKHTAHTANPVPAILTSLQVQLHDGGLSNVAPTILSLLGIPVPPSMTGSSLIRNGKEMP